MVLSTIEDAENYVNQYGDRLAGLAKYEGAQCYNDLHSVIVHFITEGGDMIKADAEIDIVEYIIDNNFWS